MRESTKLSYTKMLSEVFGAGESVNIKTLAGQYKIDVKLPTWLLDNGYFTKIADSREMVKPVSLNPEIFDTIIAQFASYRNSLDEKGAEERKAFEHYKANKQFYVDSRLTTISKETEKQTEDKIINQVVEFAEIAVKLGKKDIAGFIRVLLSTK